MELSSRRIQQAIVCVFVALTVFPLVQMIYPIVRISPIDENRTLAPAPDFFKIIVNGDGRVAAELNKWFDDRIGFRSFFIRLRNQIDYSLFGHSDKLYIGKDGTLFHRDTLNGIVAIERGGEAWQQAVQAKFTALARYLDRRGIRLVIVSNPAKETAEAELLPPEAPRLPVDTQFHKLRRFLAANPEWIYVNGQDFIGKCGDDPPFYRTDTHSTMPVGYCIAKDVVSRIAVAEGRSASFWNPSFTYFRITGFSGNLARLMAVLIKPTESIKGTHTLYHSGSAVPEGTFTADPDGFFETVYRTHESLWGDKLPPMVLYGNSFAGYYLNAGLYFQFIQVHSVQSRDISLEAALQKLPPNTRYMIVQFYEPFLGDFLQYQIPGE
jgi:hypothetical protein